MLCANRVLGRIKTEIFDPATLLIFKRNQGAVGNQNFGENFRPAHAGVPPAELSMLGG